MTRNKVKLAYIQNDTARKITFKKRKAGVVKKLDELTTLCDIEACSIIYSEFDPQPLVWPSVEEAQRLIMKFKSFSEIDQVKRKVNQETFTRQRLQKMEEKLRKQQRENNHKEMTHTMFQSIMDPQASLMQTMGDYEELTRVTNQNLMKVEKMMEMRQRESSSSFTRPSPQGGAGGSGGSGSQQLVLSNYEFMPQNHRMFQSLRPGGNNSGDGQQFGLSHGFMAPNHGMLQPPSLDFSMASNMTYPPPIMALPPPNMTYPPPANIELSSLPLNFPQNEMAYIHPNMGMPYPSNQPAFPYYYNADMSPHDPSLH